MEDTSGLSSLPTELLPGCCSKWSEPMAVLFSQRRKGGSPSGGVKERRGFLCCCACPPVRGDSFLPAVTAQSVKSGYRRPCGTVYLSL